jgi:hypothetical protein
MCAMNVNVNVRQRQWFARAGTAKSLNCRANLTMGLWTAPLQI